MTYDPRSGISPHAKTPMQTMTCGSCAASSVLVEFATDAAALHGWVQTNKRWICATCAALEAREAEIQESARERDAVAAPTLAVIAAQLTRAERAQDAVGAPGARERDAITQPARYLSGSPHETWNYIHAHGLGFMEGNIVKYVTRHRRKGGIDDLKKARAYIDKLISQCEEDAL